MAKKDGARNRKSERFEIEGTMSGEDIAAYLEDLARGLRRGSILIGEEGEAFQARTPTDMEFELDAREGKKKTRVKLTVAFRRPESTDSSSEGRDAATSAPATIPDEMSF